MKVQRRLPTLSTSGPGATYLYSKPLVPRLGPKTSNQFEANPLSSFSHHRVTIPPSGWTTAAHRQGVKMLGTLLVFLISSCIHRDLKVCRSALATVQSSSMFNLMNNIFDYH